jgi:hypothetical protein
MKAQFSALQSRLAKTMPTCHVLKPSPLLYGHQGKESFSVAFALQLQHSTTDNLQLKLFLYKKVAYTLHMD